jgi:DNA-binding response OmpR family regulator
MNNKILLVEDDQDHVDLIKMILFEDGYEVIESDPNLLHANIDQEEPCLILMDNWLGRDLGARICRNLKENLLVRHIPVVLMSASLGLKTIAQDCDADGFIEKPFDIESFSKTIKGVINGWSVT